MPPPSGAHSPAAPLPACSRSIQEAATGKTWLWAGMARTTGMGLEGDPGNSALQPCTGSITRANQPAPGSQGTARKAQGRAGAWAATPPAQYPEHSDQHIPGACQVPGTSVPPPDDCTAAQTEVESQLMKGRAGIRTLECLQHLCPRPPRVPPLVPSLSHARPCLLLLQEDLTSSFAKWAGAPRGPPTVLLFCTQGRWPPHP